MDVGTALGFYTILASKHVGSKGKAIAIEAQHESFEMLNRWMMLLKYWINAVYSKETKDLLQL